MRRAKLGKTQQQRGGGPFITIYIACYNEELLLPFTIKYYRDQYPDSTIVICDNESTDNSVAIAKSLGCEIHTWKTGGESNEKALTSLKNNVWKSAKSDWVIVCDMDELLCCNEANIKQEEGQGVTIVSTVAYDVVGESHDARLKDITLDQIKKGIRLPTYDKSICFNKKYIQEINFSEGSHTSNPKGIVKRSSVMYTLYHYKYLGKQYYLILSKLTASRRKRAGQFQELMVQDLTDQKIIDKFNEKVKNATPISPLSACRQRGGGTPTFHVLIATAGRPSLKIMLDSLKQQLGPGDAVTIIFDGKEAKGKSGIAPEWTARFKAKVNMIEQDPPLKYWGHGARNQWQTRLTPETTFILHADDDDQYLPGSFDTLRTACTDPDTLYIAKMKYRNDPKLVIPRQDSRIVQDDIGTPNGIIPFKRAGAAKWGLLHGGDFEYYNALQSKVKGVKFLPDIIYEVIPVPVGRTEVPQAGGTRGRKTRRVRRNS